MSLAMKWLAKKTKLVGTIRGHKRELPKAAKQMKDNMSHFSTFLYESENCVLTIYKSKLNKRVAVPGISLWKLIKVIKSVTELYSILQQNKIGSWYGRTYSEI